MHEAFLSLMTSASAHKMSYESGMQTASAIMNAADTTHAKLIIENDIPQYRGLVTMMTRNAMEEMSKGRDMIATITDIALKQGATVENTFLCLEDDEAAITAMIRKEREMLAAHRASSIKSAPCLAMPALRKIHRQQISIDDERNSLSRAYACATFGK